MLMHLHEFFVKPPKYGVGIEIGRAAWLPSICSPPNNRPLIKQINQADELK
jgi:hypothetical protein